MTISRFSKLILLFSQQQIRFILSNLSLPQHVEAVLPLFAPPLPAPPVAHSLLTDKLLIANRYC